jgi:hypothetical protein
MKQMAHGSIFLTGTLAFLMFPVVCQGQNIETLSIKKGIKLSGSLNISNVLYRAQGIGQRRDPFNGFVTGSLNVDLFGYSMPFSFSYSNVNKSYTQPFNQFSFSPQYKWIKVFTGYNSMTMSTYTLAGHTFFGTGLELTPGKWKISAMHGRLRKAVPFHPGDSLQYNAASFRRTGRGLKIGFESNGQMIALNIFTAKDDDRSIPFVLPESQLSPHQNVAASAAFRSTLFRRLFVEGEYAMSAMNTDTRARRQRGDTVTNASTFNFVNVFVSENATSRYYHALNTSIAYNGNLFALKLKYERVAPEYQTLGAYYFNNDFRNITVAPTVRLFRNTLTVNANCGLQKNNLDKARQSTSHRLVSALNIGFLPNEQWNAAMAYSNFSAYTNFRPQQDPFFRNNLDTLNFYQVNQTANGSVTRSLGNEKHPQSIMFNVTLQQASDNAGHQEGRSQSEFTTVNATYTFSDIASNLNLAISVNYYITRAARVESRYYGPTFNITKAYLEKTIRCTLGGSYNATSGMGRSGGSVLNNRAAVSYTPKSSKGKSLSPHNLSLGCNVLTRAQNGSSPTTSTEFTGTMNYTFTF